MRALSHNGITINNLSESEDTVVLKKALSSSSTEINIGHAGTAMRFLTAYLSISEGDFFLTGSDRMKERPIGKLVEALQHLGADIQYAGKEGFPPLRIKGKKWQGNAIEIDGSTSSQYISALLLIAPALPSGITLRLTGNIISASYIRLTLRLMQQAGINYRWEGNVISIPPQTYREISIRVEPDWSAASYWYSIAAVAGDPNIFINDLSAGSMQGDSVIENLFHGLGVKTMYNPKGACLTRAIKKESFLSHDFTEHPDIVQTMAVCLVLMGIPYRFTGTQSLRIKETDRIVALQQELSKLGAILKYKDSGILQWDGHRNGEWPVNPRFSTYEDHRMAMAMIPAGLRCGSVTIENPDVVIKSYPSFWEELRKAGFTITSL